MNIRDIPNFITWFRLILLVPFLYSILQENYRPAFLIFFLAGFSDAVDGYLARTFKWTSRFGAFLDPLADKLLMLSSLSALMWLGHIPLWIFAIVVGRDMIILGGVTTVVLMCGNVEYKPTFVSKVNTVIQIGYVCTLLFGLAFTPFPELFVTALLWAMITTSIISVLQYIKLGTTTALNC
jgi:cardiolipin synthase (CMP-forming)